jgi:pyrroline-5-carboxylate reductase
MKIACIGTGEMGSALMKGLVETVGAANICLANRTRAKAEALAKTLGGAHVCASNSEAARAGDYVFLAVKPQNLEALLKEIAPALPEKAVPVSLAAGWSIEKIQALVQQPLVRIMPSTPVEIGCGVVALKAGPAVPSERLAELKTMLSACGLVEELDEKLLDSVGALAGSSPAFVYMFIEALADGGVRAGFSHEQALKFAAKAVEGAGRMVLETGLHPGQLKDQVASPGGSTIVGIAALEDRGFRGAVMEALRATIERNAHLA